MLGFSHTSKAKDQLIKDLFDTPGKMADVMEVFARAGCNAFMSLPSEFSAEAMQEVEQRTGVEMLWICTPSYAEPGDPDSWQHSVELTKKLGAQFCFPHQSVTDLLIDRANRCLHPCLLDHLRIVREMEMIPGLSTHAPEAIMFSDASAADVESYIQPYNAAGFLCQIETDWLAGIIRDAKKPVMTIKPLASGRLHPLTGLTFAWQTIRDCDLVTVGTMSAYEAEEVIEISLACLEGREPNLDLQFTRSKKVLVGEQAEAADRASSRSQAK
jgi:hypothetical protein